MINIADSPIFGRDRGPCIAVPPKAGGEGCTGVPALKLGMKLWGIFLQKQGQGA